MGARSSVLQRKDLGEKISVPVRGPAKLLRLYNDVQLAVSMMRAENIFGASVAELDELVRRGGEPSYRARQIFQALYSARISSWDEISSLPKSFRSWLVSSGYVIDRPKIAGKFHSQDGTLRYLVEVSDRETVETVWMPEGDDGESGDGSEAGEEKRSSTDSFYRATICISSQVGCAVNCHFCLTAALGVRRNLSAGEIVGQVLAVLEDRGVTPPRQRINLVFMGMGEPFLNYENFMKAVSLLVQGVGVPDGRMTVSTAGVAPRIADFGREQVRPKLAISLNAPNDQIRDQIMPINRKWSLDVLLRAAREFPLRSRSAIDPTNAGFPEEQLRRWRDREIDSQGHVLFLRHPPVRGEKLFRRFVPDRSRQRPVRRRKDPNRRQCPQSIVRAPSRLDRAASGCVR